MYKLLLFFVCTVFTVNAQEHAWLFLKDKPNATTYLNNPLTMLSQRALDRRTTQNIALNETDVPLETTYYNQIASSEEITVLAKSKWLNAIHVFGEQDAISSLLSSFDFIESIEFANKNINTSLKIATSEVKTHYNKFQETTTDFDYGEALNQIKMLGGDFLHENGFTGEGMYIAIIDGGFPNVNTLDAFSRLRDNNQILGGYDFVDRSEDFYSGDSHGTHVLSDIGGYIENEFVGTAPDASFFLFRTEDGPNETPLEETLWVEAAERADSLGVDVVNTSLGYTIFDNSNYNYSYEDMDGKTTFISRGANVGTTKGILFVNSAGNSGSSTWKYIGAPADVENVFSIGAVDASEIIASFSSFGPTADGRIKPDVLAQGQSAYVINYITGQPVTSSGTSFSSPIITGVMACFWQAFPDKSSLEIMQIIRESADKYLNPTDQYGYGIPDFEEAYGTTLSQSEIIKNFNNINIYPNPVENTLTISLNKNDLEVCDVVISSVLGEVMINEKLISNQVNVSNLIKGVYWLKIIYNEKTQIFKFIKK